MSNAPTFDHVNNNAHSQESTKLWFYLSNDEQKGPCLLDAITTLYRNREINDATLVWSEGMAQWMPLSATISIAPQPPAYVQSAPVVPSTEAVSSSYNSPDTLQRIVPQPSSVVNNDSLFSFDGRMSRGDFWSTYIALIIVLVIVFSVLFAISEALAGVVAFIAFIPVVWLSFALSIRRLHDINYSGWWLLVSFIPYIGAFLLFIFYCLPGTEGNNTYGSKPSK